ncbi:MAG: type I phosphomannose isomerase catalytic subunit [Terriglobales bacterium]
MSDLYPLLMQPLFDPRPWGMLDLSPIYPRRFEEKIGESWLTGDHCQIQNGALAGKSLAELASLYRRELVGDAPANESRFPLLAKFLFPHEKLSVQVHPDDDDARAIGQPWGKTECWYVAHATPEAEIGLGLKNGTTRAQFEKAIHENRAEGLLNWVKVAAGDMIYVAGGTVHTLGPGSIIVETQQQSDTTFRLYDYGRPRELHLEHGLRVIKEQVGSGKVKRREFSKTAMNGNRVLPLVESPYFSVERVELHGEHRFDFSADGKSSAQILVVVDGSGRLVAAGCEEVKFGKGDAVVIPASLRHFKVQPEGEAQLLRSYVPGKTMPAPQTYID